LSYITLATTQHTTHNLSICNAPQRPNQLPRPLCVSPTHSVMPCELTFTGFFCLVSLWQQPGIPPTPDTSMYPNSQTDHHALTLSPTPTPPMWKPHKSASMSRQHHWSALRASDNVAGTWKWFFVSSTSAAHLSIVPIHALDHPIDQEATQTPEHVEDKNCQCGSCPSRPPIHVE
jgi:hypothetical protein